MNYRRIRDVSSDSYSFRLDPKSRTSQNFSGFIQDKIAITEDRLCLTVGSKFEHNTYTDFEYQPSGRITWTPNDNETYWAAVSRAVHTPTRYERDAYNSMVTFPFTWDSVKNPDFGSEELIAYELGYRIKPDDRLMIDTALFFNDYQNMRTGQNLLDSRHPEFTRSDFQEFTEVQRAFLVKLTHRF